MGLPGAAKCCNRRDGSGSIAPRTIDVMLAGARSFACVIAVLASIQRAGGAPLPTELPAPDIVTFRTFEYDLVDGADAKPISLRVVLAPGVSPDRVRVVIVDAALQGRHEEKLLDGLSGRVEVDGFGARLMLSGSELLARAGTYFITMTVSDRDESQAVKAVTQTVKLKHPAAKGRIVPETVVIERVGFLPHTGIWEVPEMSLEETTGASRVTSVRSRDLGCTDDDGATVHTLITFSVVGEVPAGDRVPLGVAISGSTSTAKLIGKAELIAPQLDQPVIVSYELRSHIDRITVILMLSVGLGFGLGAKYSLRRVVEVLRRRRELAEIAQQASELTQRSDSELSAAGQRVQTACMTERSGRTPKLLQSAVEKQRTELAGAVSEWNTRLATERVRLQELGQALETAWRIPPALASVIDPLRTSTIRARDELARGDAAKARSLVNEALALPGVERQKIADWWTSVRAVAHQLAESPTARATPWPEAATAVASQTASRLSELVMDVEPKIPGDLASLSAWLATIDAVQATFMASAERMATTWSLVVSSAQAELAGAASNPLARFEELLPALDANPHRYLSEIANKGASIVDKFHERLTTGLSATAGNEIAALLAAGKWSRAAATAKLALAAGQAQRMTKPPAPPTTPEPIPPPTTMWSPPPPAAFAVSLPSGYVDAVLHAAIRAETISQWVTSSISFVAIVALYGLHYADKPIASWPELLGVFAQAATLDITLDAILQAVRLK